MTDHTPTQDRARSPVELLERQVGWKGYDCDECGRGDFAEQVLDQLLLTTTIRPEVIEAIMVAAHQVKGAMDAKEREEADASQRAFDAMTPEQQAAHRHHMDLLRQQYELLAGIVPALLGNSPEHFVDPQRSVRVRIVGVDEIGSGPLRIADAFGKTPEDVWQ